MNPNDYEMTMYAGEVAIHNRNTGKIIMLPEEVAIAFAYKILTATQDIEQVMNQVQQSIDEQIERDHGIITTGENDEI
jgi:hypothetical protein